MAPHRNQWYCGTIDDILPDLAQYTVVVMVNATSEYCPITSDLQSNLLTIVNTPWVKFRCLRLSFDIRVVSNILQEWPESFKSG